jgi:hypothetical protein
MSLPVVVFVRASDTSRGDRAGANSPVPRRLTCSDLCRPQRGFFA